MKLDMIFGWLKDPGFRPERGEALDTKFLDVKARTFSTAPHEGRDADVISPTAVPSVGSIEIVLAGGHRDKAEGAFDHDVLTWLLKG